MAKMTAESVIQEVTEDLTTELQNDVDFNADVLAVKVKNVYREVVGRRCYENSSIADEDIADDVYKNYYHVLVKVARYDYNQIGVEGEIVHSENGIDRQYVDRDKLFGDVLPFVKMF